MSDPRNVKNSTLAFELLSYDLSSSSMKSALAVFGSRWIEAMIESSAFFHNSTDKNSSSREAWNENITSAISSIAVSERENPLPSVLSRFGNANKGYC